MVLAKFGHKHWPPFCPTYVLAAPSAKKHVGPNFGGQSFCGQTLPKPFSTKPPCPRPPYPAPRAPPSARARPPRPRRGRRAGRTRGLWRRASAPATGGAGRGAKWGFRRWGVLPGALMLGAAAPAHQASAPQTPMRGGCRFPRACRPRATPWTPAILWALASRSLALSGRKGAFA